jgi:hypothetical protein
MNFNYWCDRLKGDSAILKSRYNEECQRVATKLACTLSMMGVNRMYFTQNNLRFCQLNTQSSINALDLMQRLGYISLQKVDGCLDITIIDEI